MGSQSDWATMQAAAQILEALGIAYESRIVSAHRTPDRIAAYAKEAEGRGLKVIIAGAGGAAHLPGMAACMTSLPVLGVPVERALKGMDSLLSIAQMPGGVPVATFAIGESGRQERGPPCRGDPGADGSSPNASPPGAQTDEAVAERPNRRR